MAQPSSSSSFQSKFDEKLIDLVRQYSVIWDPAKKSYMGRVIRDNAWKEIAVQVNRSDKECKMRWRTIRDSYKKVRKLTTVLGASECRSKYRKMDNLRFLDCVSDARRSTSEMAAVSIKIEQDVDDMFEEEELPRDDDGDDDSNDEVLENTSDTSVQHDCRTGDGDSLNDNSRTDDTVDVMERNGKEESLQNIVIPREDRTNICRDLPQETENHIYTFFRSMAQSVSSFPEHLIIETKLKVCQLISEMEMKALMERSCNGHPP